MAAIAIYDFDRHSMPKINTDVPQYLLYRPLQKFTERNRLVLNLLQPHLVQAYQTFLHFQQLQQYFLAIVNVCPKPPGCSWASRICTVLPEFAIKAPKTNAVEEEFRSQTKTR